MPIEIDAPDGAVVEFPDGTSDLVIQAAMQKAYGAPPKRTSQAQGFMKGLNRTAANMAPLIGAMSPATAAMVKAQNTAAQEGIRQREADGVASGKAGDIVGSLLMAAPTMAMGGPITSGALSGYAMSEANGLPGKLGDAALGAVGGKVGSAIIGKVSGALGKTISPAARRLRSVGVKLTPGQARGGAAMVREDKAMSLPGVGDSIAGRRREAAEGFMKAGANRALNPLGKTVPETADAGHEAVAAMQKMVSDAYDDVVPQMSLKLDPKAITPILSKFNSTLNGLQRGQYQATVKNLLRDGDLAGKQVQDVRRELQRLAAGYSNSAVMAERELGNAYGQLLRDFDARLMLQNPEQAKAFMAANKAYRGSMIVNDAASKADDGVYSSGQFQQAVRKGDRTKGKSAMARGGAFMQDLAKAGREVLPQRVPNSGTADRLQNGLVSKLRGAAADLGYRADQAMTDFVTSPEGAWTAPVAEAVDALRRPAGAAAAGAVSAAIPTAAAAAPPQGDGVELEMADGTRFGKTAEGRRYRINVDGSWNWLN